MRAWFKRIGYVVGVIAVLVLVAGGAVYAMSESRFHRAYAVPAETFSIVADSVTLARGEHLSSAIAGCGACHGPGLGGAAMFDRAPMGRVVALNLTSGEGGVGKQLTPDIIERAVRHGVGHDGRALRIMPADDFQYMSDDDVRAVIAYVQHLAPVNNVLAPTNLMLLPRALLLAGKMPLLPAEGMRDSAGKPMSAVPGLPQSMGPISRSSQGVANATARAFPAAGWTSAIRRGVRRRISRSREILVVGPRRSFSRRCEAGSARTATS